MPPPRRRRPAAARRAAGLCAALCALLRGASAARGCFAGGGAPGRGAGRRASEVALRARTAVDSYLKELPNGDLQLDPSGEDGLLPEVAVPEDNLLNFVLPSGFSDVTPLGILVNFLLPSLVLFILLMLSTPLIDKYVLGEEYEIDWSGRSGKYWDILFGKGAKAYIGKPQFADGDSLRQGKVEIAEGGAADQGAGSGGAETKTK